MPQPRKYTLCYEIKQEGRKTQNVWLSTLGLEKPSAVRHFQSILLAGSFAGFSMALKPMPENLDGVQVDRNRESFFQVLGNCRTTGTMVKGQEVTR